MSKYKGVKLDIKEREYLEEYFKKEWTKTSYTRKVERNK